MRQGVIGGPASPAQAVGRVTLEVSGGFTGWDRIVVVEPDGLVTIQTVRPAPGTHAGRSLAGADLKRLHSLIADPSFARLERSYHPATQGADEQDYVVTAVIGPSLFTTMTRDGAVVPEILREVLDILMSVLTQG
jgi:hypothetical protein